VPLAEYPILFEPELKNPVPTSPTEKATVEALEEVTLTCPALAFP